MEQSTNWILLLLLSAFILGAQSRPEGPPLSTNTFNGICNQLMPSHGGSARSDNGGYTITTNIPRSGSTGYGYTAGQTYSGDYKMIAKKSILAKKNYNENKFMIKLKINYLSLSYSSLIGPCDIQSE
jgi:hypothetical protein